MGYPNEQRDANQPAGQACGMPDNDPWVRQNMQAAQSADPAQAPNRYTERDEKTAQLPDRSSGGGRIVLLAMLLLAGGLLFFGAETWLSVSKYSIMRGLAGSPIVGTQNFYRFISTSSFPTAMTNSLINGLITIALTVLMGFAGAAMGRGSVAGRRIGVTAGLLLAVVPRIFWERLTMSVDATILTASLCSALSWCGMGLAGAALLTGRERRGVAPAALIVPAMELIMFFELDGIPSLMSSGIFGRLQTMNDVIFSQGYINFNLSLAGAGNVLSAVIGLLPCIAGFLMITFMTRGYAGERKLQRGSFADAVPGLAAGVILIAAGAVLVAGHGSESAYGAVLYTLEEIAIMLFLGFGIFLLFQVLGGKNRAAGSGAGFARALLVFAAFSLARSWMVKYLFCSRLGLINTIYAVVLSWLLAPKTVMLALLLALSRPENVKQCVRNALAIALMGAVFGIGEMRGSYLYLNMAQDASGYLYRSLMSAQTAAVTESISSAMEAAAARASLMKGAWGVMLLTAGLPLGGGMALTAMAVSKE